MHRSLMTLKYIIKVFHIKQNASRICSEFHILQEADIISIMYVQEDGWPGGNVQLKKTNIRLLLVAAKGVICPVHH